MSSATEGARTGGPRHRARLGARRVVRRVATAATAFVAGGVILSLVAAGGTMAAWTGSVSITAPSIRSGSITATLGGFTGLSTTFTSNALTKTSWIQMGNSGATTAQYAAQLSLAAGSSSSMAGTTWATMWIANAPADCTETAVPGPGVSYPWNAVPVFTGTLPAGASGYYCVRSRTAAANLIGTASITPQVTVTLSVPNTGWTSVATASATESTAADPAVTGNEYTDAVRTDGATNYWRLGEPSGSILYDLVGSDDAYAGSGLTRGVAGALTADSNTATTFSGDANGTAGTRNPISGPQSFAVEAWFKTTSTTGGKIVGFGGNSTGLSSSYDRHIYLDAAGHVVWGVWPGYASTVTTSGAYNDGQWHHVVGNLSASGQSMYVDGVLIGTTAVTSAQAYTGYWRIGGDNAWAGDAYFDGTIDDVAVYGAPLSARAITNHYNLSGRGAYPAGVGDPYGSVVYGDSPTIYWRLGDSSAATTALDSSATGANTGVYSGGVTKPVSGAVPGTRNTAASFGGTNGLVATQTAVAAPNVFSLELWFNTTSTAGGKLIGFGSSQTGASSTYDRHIWLDTAGRLNFGVYNPGSVTVTSPAAYNNGQWHHVTATLSSLGMRLFADGQLVASNTSQTTAQGNTGYWRVGGDATWSGAQYINGQIDEVAIYSTALSTSHVKRHYSVATGVPAASWSSTISGLAASFDGSASSDYDGSVASYSWNYGDATATGTGATSSHTYASPGTYTVTLTVTDDTGRTDSLARAITVTDTTAPTTPGTPTVTSNTGTTVGLSWAASTDNVAVSAYEVYRNGALIATTATNSYTDTGRSLNTTYSYAVKARDASSNVSGLSGSVSVTTATVDTAPFYTVKASNALCLGASSATANGQLQQLSCATSTAQNFKLTATDSGWFKVNLRSQSTIAWDVSGGSTTSGAPILTYGYTGSANQQWKPVAQNDPTNSYWFVNRNSGMCLTVPGYSGTPGTQLTQEACVAGASNQMFTMAVAP